MTPEANCMGTLVTGPLNNRLGVLWHKNQLILWWESLLGISASPQLSVSHCQFQSDPTNAEVASGVPQLSYKGRAG